MKPSKQKTLVLVESPSKAAKIKSYLGDDYIVKSTKGHILELMSGGKYGLGVDIQNNFQPRYKIMSDKIDLMQELMDIAADAKEVILASDNDREGCAISRHIYDRLKDYNTTFKRITFSEITKKAILKSLEQSEDILSPTNVNMYQSQTARRVLDRLVGYMASPFLAQYFGPNLSAGRVQSCILRMLVEREEQIAAFIPEEYFNIHATFAKAQQSFTAKYDSKITDKTTAQHIQAILSKPNTRFIVRQVESNQEIKKPLPPLITAKLQQIMSKQYKINATRTMAAAQSLYEASHITYMRTDSVRVSDEANKSLRAWLKDHDHDIPKSINLFKNKNTSQDAHEAIRPCDITDMPQQMDHLSDDEKQVYEVIWKYFVASQMKPAIFDTLKVVIQAEDHPYTFIASGKSLQYKGFLAMLDINYTGSIDIPTLMVDDVLFLHGPTPIVIEDKQTQPPPHYSEASLIETLEKKEIGRPSTYSTLLATITTRNYAEQSGNTFYPTELGKTITHELVKWFSFLEYDYTSKLELELDKIAEGQLDYGVMLRDFYTAFSQELTKAYVGHGSPMCDKCGSFMKEIVMKNGTRFWGCSGYPNCYASKKIEDIINNSNP